VIVIDSEGQGTAAECKKHALTFAHQHRLTMPVLVESDNSASQRYNIEAIPTNVIIDKDGIVRYWAEGFDQEKVWQTLHSLGIK
jgi:peroxiredoxin